MMDVDDTSSNNVVMRINGALMNNYISNHAILVGFVQRLEGENKRIVIRTTDNAYVQVMLPQAINFIIEPEQLIEAYGTVKGANKFECERFCHFGLEDSKEFDCDSYNKLIQMFITHQNRFCIDPAAATEQQSEPILQSVNNDFDCMAKSEIQFNSFQ